MKKITMFIWIHFVGLHTIMAQQKSAPVQRPKLVVGIVVDQMRWDYLYQFRSLFGNDGINRLVDSGFSCENTLISHLPTVTAVGHAGIYTGAYPSVHGIVGNSWYDNILGKSVYCTDDSTVRGVGTTNPDGKMSPRNMNANTITDELRIHTQFQSKVVGIAIKDRGAILPAGHAANAAYWFDENIGKMVSSTYYMDSLPQWVNDFNASGLPDRFMSKPWTLMREADAYPSAEDDMAFESSIPGLTSKSFPHRIDLLKEKKYDAFRYTPFGNDYTMAFALEALRNEKLGKHDATDFLTLSFSSTDLVGHLFGPNSLEVQDAYVRLDRNISELLNELDQTLGKNNYLVFLSADHAVAHIPEFLKSHQLPGGSFSMKQLMYQANDTLRKKFGVQNYLIRYDNYQFTINKNLSQVEIESESINQWLLQWLMNQPFINFAYLNQEIASTVVPEPIRSMAMNSYHAKRCGDIQIIPNPGFQEGGKTGTGHAVWNPYDAHIPLVWFGWKVPKGSSYKAVHMTDIAPTLAALLRIQMPSGSAGSVIEELMQKK